MTSTDAPRLVITAPTKLAGTEFALTSAETVIGHSDAADLILKDKYVSHRHALITVDENGQVTVHDLNSTGGTFVNDEQIDAPRALQSGDIVRFADVEARFEAATAATAAATATPPRWPRRRCGPPRPRSRAPRLRTPSHPPTSPRAL